MGAVCCRNTLEQLDIEEQSLTVGDLNKEPSTTTDLRKAPGIPGAAGQKPLDNAFSQGSPNGRTLSRPMSEALPEVATKTLTTNGLDGDVAERHKAFEKRKEARKKKRSEKQAAGQGPSAMLLKDGFLSNVPEVDTDIAYRYAFIVMGYMTAGVVEAACLSEVARGLPHAANADIIRAQDEPAEGMDSPNRLVEAAETAAAGSAAKANAELSKTKASRCLCPVPYPTGRTNENDRLKLAKLVFSTYSYGQEPPECYSRLEASTCAAVFILIVDPESAQERMDVFSEQLWAIERAVQSMRFRSRPEFRPVRAVIICRAGPAPQDQGNEPWREQLEDFEQMNGSLWKFGTDRPIGVQDGNDLHSCFAQIASSRILRNGDGGDSDRSAEEPMPVWATENENEKTEVDDRAPSKGSSGNALMKTLAGARSMINKN